MHEAELSSFRSVHFSPGLFILQNLYGKKIEVHFLDFMRPEMKFSGVDELKMQVLKDKETGRKMHGAER